MLYNVGKMLKTVVEAGTLRTIGAGTLVLMEEATNLPEDSEFKYFVTPLIAGQPLGDSMAAEDGDVGSVIPRSKLTQKQCKTTSPRAVEDYEPGASMIVELRFDDQCGNGHNTFSITGEIRGRRGGFVAGGCLHDEIAKYFPEYAGFIKWHLCSTEGPMHYVANTIWHASDKDCWGGRKGEVRWYRYDLGITTKKGKKELLFANRHTKPHELLTEEEATEIAVRCGLEVVPVPWMYHEGKDSDLAAARNSAIWPDATLEQLLDKATLLTRLPELLRDFKLAMQELGFTY